MKKGQNTNRPAKGSQIKVQPITKSKDIKAIKKLLADNPRDFCLFVLGINTNLRASDLTQITVGMVKDKKGGDELELKEKKTGNPPLPWFIGLPAGGLFLAIGGLFAITRRSIRIDRPNGVFEERLGILFPIKRTTHKLRGTSKLIGPKNGADMEL